MIKSRLARWIVLHSALWPPHLWSLRFSFLQTSAGLHHMWPPALVSSRHNRGAATCRFNTLVLSPPSTRHSSPRWSIKDCWYATECYSNEGNAALFRIILTSITYLWRSLLHKDNKTRWSNQLWLSTYLLSAAPKHPNKQVICHWLECLSLNQLSHGALGTFQRVWHCLASDYQAVALMWRIYGHETLTLQSGPQNNIVLIEAARL